MYDINYSEFALAWSNLRLFPQYLIYRGTAYAYVYEYKFLIIDTNENKYPWAGIVFILPHIHSL